MISTNFLRIKLDILVNIHANFYRKRMRITIKIIRYKNAKFNIGHPLVYFFIIIIK